MSHTFSVSLVTPQGVILDEQVVSLYVSALSGEMEILSGHEEMVVCLDSGPVIVRYGAQKTQFFYVTGGILEITNTQTSVISEEATRIDALDEASLEKTIAAIEERKNRSSETYAKESRHTDTQAIRAKVEIIRRLKGSKGR
ncbi:MAG: ATP synthase F1 subunit epsilon [Alphaproteobacteria bacterium]|nr:MAG: ATP synthase F1 subunit epsilon [Alphaproteobacteria bacterium]